MQCVEFIQCKQQTILIDFPLLESFSISFFVSYTDSHTSTQARNELKNFFIKKTKINKLSVFIYQFQALCRIRAYSLYDLTETNMKQKTYTTQYILLDQMSKWWFWQLCSSTKQYKQYLAILTTASRKQVEKIYLTKNEIVFLKQKIS